MRKLLSFLVIAIFMVPAGAFGGALPADIDLADGAENLGARASFFTAQQGYAAGSGNQSTAFGDFNRDGLDDLVVAYSTTNITGTNNGIVFVVFGAAEYPNTQSVGTSDAASVYCQDDGAGLGYSVAAGDLDGDGIDELLIGATGANNGKGAVAIINGTTLSPSSVQAVNFSLGSPTSGETRVLGTQDGAQFGYSLAVGNFDGDDKIDVAAGEPYADVDGGGKVDAGKCYVWYGKDYVAGTTVDNTALTDRWEILGGAGDNVGTSLATGEGDNDGLDNLAIGAIGYGSSSRVYYMGVLSPGTTSYELDDMNNLNHGAFDGVPGLGFSLAMADLSSVGRVALLMGAPLYGHDGLTYSGAVIEYIDLQSVVGAGFITLDVTTPSADALVYLGATDGGLFGGSVAYSDLNGDLTPDEIIGEPGGPGADAQSQAGRVHVRYGPYSPATGILDLADAALDVTVTGEAGLGYCGASVAGEGDVDGDGIADLLVMAPFAVQGAPGLGNVYLLNGGYDDFQDYRGTRTILKAGPTPNYSAGGRLSPVARFKIKFADGDLGYISVAPCIGECTANLGAGDGSNIADTVWYASLTRANVTSATVTVNYTDADIAGFSEDYLGLYRAESPSGPWTRAENQVHSPDSNEFTTAFAIGESAYFAILLEAPTITLAGSDENDIDWECGTPYVDPGATAFSTVDGDVSELLVVDDSAVDAFTPGDYTVTFNVTDSTGAPAPEAVRTVHVRDNISPAIELEGGQVIVECGDTLVLPGYSAYDACEGDVSGAVVISGLETVDTTTPGNYLISYDVMDSNNNAAQSALRAIHVQDTTAPTITRIGDEIVEWECGVPWVDPGATAFDTCDGDITDVIEVAGQTVDTSGESNALINYRVRDGANNVSEYVYRTVQVRDTTPPVITLIGEAEITVECRQPYVDAGATMFDTCEGDVTNRLNSSASSVNTNVPGDYTVTYTGNDGGNGQTNTAVPVTRTVHVVCSPETIQSADLDANLVITLTELLRPIQLYNSLGYHCADSPGDTEDGFVPGAGVNQSCVPYDTDYNPQDWVISLTELLRMIQFYNSLGYHYCPGENTEDGFCPGAA